MRLKCIHRTTFCGKLRLQKCPQVRAMAKLAKTPKSAIFWKSSKGGPRENRPTSRPNSQAPKTPRRKSHLLLISTRLKCIYRTTFCRKARLQKCPQVWAMANLAKTPKSAIFWKSSKGGPRENRPKSRPNSQVPKTPRRKSHRLLISMRLKCIHRTTFCRKLRLQKCPQVRAMAKYAVHEPLTLMFIPKKIKCLVGYNYSKRGHCSVILLLSNSKICILSMPSGALVVEL